MLWFHGLLVGKTWHPPTTVRGPAGDLVDGGWDAGLALGRGVARAVATAVTDAESVGDAVTSGRAPRAPPPAGVGTACPDGPAQAVTTTSEQTSAIASLRHGVPARIRIKAVACPPRHHQS